MTTNWYQYGVEMAQKFCNGDCEYAQRGSQYIAEYEGIVGTNAEKDFCDGWSTVVSLDGQVLYHQILYKKSLPLGCRQAKSK